MNETSLFDRCDIDYSTGKSSDMKEFSLKQPSTLYLFCNGDYDTSSGLGVYYGQVSDSDELFSICKDVISTLYEKSVLSHIHNRYFSKTSVSHLQQFNNISCMVNVVNCNKIFPTDCKLETYTSTLDYINFRENSSNPMLLENILYEHIINSIDFSVLEKIGVLEYNS